MLSLCAFYHLCVLSVQILMCVFCFLWLLEAACNSVSIVAEAAPSLVVVGPAQGKLQQAQKTSL